MTARIVPESKYNFHNPIGKYILKDKKVVRVYDLFEWAKWMEEDRSVRRVAEDFVGKVHISTVFLGLDHNWGFSKKPVLFETMIFGGKHDQYQARYCTWNEAVKGHKKAVNLVKG